ncbi:MAG: hypothetical protein KOO60_10790 [Gemmatimonadales bacterium]|nr:hypothetical protein [Gemmatimonadales bacterium]
MSERGATRAWIPPQREPSESKTRYLAVLAKRVELLERMAKDGNREVKKRCAHRIEECIRARNACLTGREK